MRGGMLIVDMRDWIDDYGDVPLKPARFRRNALRVAQLIEYGGPLKVGETRETLVQCTKRPKGEPCPGLMWVAKQEDKRIYAYCIHCHQNEVVIAGWEETIWAEGMMEPVPVPSDDDLDDTPPTRH